MLSDLKPIIVDLPEGKDAYLHPISDLHYGSPQFNQKRWEQFISEIAGKENHYVVIVGDLMNNALKNSKSNVYEDTCSPSMQKRWLVEQLRPIKHQIIGGTGGNHEARSVKETDESPLYDVFSKLDIEDKYREGAAFLIIRFGGDERGKFNARKRPTYVGCLTHGFGGGSIGASANRNEKFGMAIDGLDFLVTGHTHKPITFPSAKLKVDPFNKQVVVQEFTVVTATSWLDYGGYPLSMMLSPTAFRPCEIKLSSVGKKITVTQ